MTDVLTWLQEYYLSQCDSDWEHTYAFQIGNLDNPGWRLDFDLKETEMEGKNFPPIKIERSEDDWIYCKVDKDVFQGNGGPLNLTELLTIFREWVERVHGSK